MAQALQREGRSAPIYRATNPALSRNSILMIADDCRFCGEPLQYSFCDLGMSPLSNAFIDAAQLQAPEVFFPLHGRVCGACYLVQVREFESPAKIFSDYAYFSS